MAAEEKEILPEKWAPILSRLRKGELLVSVLEDPAVQKGWIAPSEQMQFDKTLQYMRSLSYFPDRTPLAIVGLEKQGLPQIFLQYLTYPSGRPRTEMSFVPNIKPLQAFLAKSPRHFEVENVEKIKVSPNIYSGKERKKTFVVADDALLPIVRYASGMAQGLFNPEIGQEAFAEEKGYCGTFYYFEPSSQFWLHAPKVAFSPNKITMFLHLAERFFRTKGAGFEFLGDQVRTIAAVIEILANGLATELVKFIDTWNEHYKPHLKSEVEFRLESFGAKYALANYWESDPEYDPATFERVLRREREVPDRGNKAEPGEEEDTYILGSDGALTALITDMYQGEFDFEKYHQFWVAAEDFLDSEICKLGKELGFDILVMTDMTGMRRNVSELDDLRRREASFAAIYRK